MDAILEILSRGIEPLLGPGKRALHFRLAAAARTGDAGRTP